ncbi:MAG: tetratricopeptide repeat protein [Bacteroidia bacterium]
MKNWLTYLFLLFAVVSFAQKQRVAKALEYIEAGNFDNAKTEIDAALQNETTNKDSYAWYVKGFVYKELYKKNEKNNPYSPLRNEAIAALKKSMELDVNGENINENKQTLKFLATTLNNDAASSINANNPEAAQKTFEKYKETMLLIDPQTDLKPKTIEFLLALASMLNNQYQAEKDSTKKEFKFLGIKNMYQEVLKLDPNNISANYNLGILYYNKAVNIINNLDYDMDMFALMEIQDNCVEIFKQSLPFMEKALALDPNRVETLRGLEGIYISLNEFEKSNAIRARLDALDK